VVCGLLASTSVALLHASAVIGDRAGLPGPAVVVGTIVVAVAVAFVHARVRVPDLVVIAACAFLSLGIVLAVPGLSALRRPRSTLGASPGRDRPRPAAEQRVRPRGDVLLAGGVVR